MQIQCNAERLKFEAIERRAVVAVFEPLGTVHVPLGWSMLPA